MPWNVPPPLAHLAFRVSWSTEDMEFVATCDQYPSLSWLDATPTEAIAGLEALLTEPARREQRCFDNLCRLPSGHAGDHEDDTASWPSENPHALG